jgi:hypothetical protein
MKKVKVFSNSYPEDVQPALDRWLEENKDVRILSINGSMNDKKDVITYVLYEDSTTADFLNS